MRAPLAPMGVAKRHRAAVHVDASDVDPQPPPGDDGHAGERLVDLPKVHVGRFQA